MSGNTEFIPAFSTCAILSIIPPHSAALTRCRRLADELDTSASASCSFAGFWE
jgi:hypothetical protein